MFIVYIIYSTLLDTYYVGQTEDINRRLEEHNTSKYEGSFSSTTNDWVLFYIIQCETRTQSMKIESHIKRMKSRKYYQSLKKYPEVSKRLLEKYK